VADSTPYVLVAGGIVFADRLLNKGTPDLVVAASTGAAALVTAGLDVLVPGLGKGAAVLLVLGAMLTSGPAVINALTIKKGNP
jgi:hypothetical protein